MPSLHALSVRSSLQFAFSMLSLSFVLLFPGRSANGQPAKVSVLQLGATGTMTGNENSAREKAGRETLHRFIKEETGLDNNNVGPLTWTEIASKLANGQLHLGTFHGHEFAWAQEKYPELRALALGVNGQRYSVAYVLTLRDNPAADFADLKGQSLAVPSLSQPFLRLFIDRRGELGGTKAETFFSRITTPENVEDALDDVVDGKVQGVVIDQATLEAYKRRKPGRFNKLKEVARSAPFPPTVVAYYGNNLDEATRQRFMTLLLSAARKEKGEMLLTLSRMTGFEAVPDDFNRLLAETRKAYPVPSTKD